MARRQALLAALLAAVFGSSSLCAEPAKSAAPPSAAVSDVQRAEAKKRGYIARICDLIETHASANKLPEAFFARLIWKESRFDAGAVSPAGAEGIAQFMPGTAAMRGLENSFDVEQALPASAAYLAELRSRFGNLGLAAAAYNSGEGRVSRWLASGGFLPLETENYVLDILGAPADSFVGAKDGASVPLDPKKSFAEACRELPVVRVATMPMARISTKPWAVQVAGNTRRAAAVQQYERVKRRVGSLLRNEEVAVSRIRSPRGRGGIYVVRVGADSRSEADNLCQRLRGSGGSCIVRRNR
ncbi:MAG TPA: lytic transglycosylase domain-containing protein [Tianweitania sediminis]|nr:lytic transglycosylase domain-containing protein [Tianweitania sediminis]